MFMSVCVCMYVCMYAQNIIDPLSREIETDLRLHIHSVVLEQANLRNKKVNDLSKYVCVCVCVCVCIAREREKDIHEICCD